MLPFFEYFFGITKQVVYDKNWKVNDRAHLVRRINKEILMTDINPIIKMFDQLKEKIRKADNFELRSLQKIPNI